MPTFILDSGSTYEKSGKKFWEHRDISFLFSWFFLKDIALILQFGSKRKISVLLKIIE